MEIGYGERKDLKSTDTHCSVAKQTMDVQDEKGMSFSAGFRLALAGFMQLAPRMHQNWDNLK